MLLDVTHPTGSPTNIVPRITRDTARNNFRALIENRPLLKIKKEVLRTRRGGNACIHPLHTQNRRFDFALRKLPFRGSEAAAMYIYEETLVGWPES